MKKPITNGILGLFEKYPQTATTLKNLAQDILRGPGILEPSEREMIAVFTSAKNRCGFCSQSHGAIAQTLGVDRDIVDGLMRAEISPTLPERMRCFLTVADYTTENRYLPLGLLAMAEKLGITEEQVYDTVLIAAMFCMFNRYVELLSRYPSDPEFYKAIGEQIASSGYL